MSEMFFFEKDPCWMQYINELGIQAVIDHLKNGGHPCGWPLKVADPEEKYTFFHPLGKGFNCYKSQCPNYEGYYLNGINGAVKCSGCPELLPGIVVDTICRKAFATCPYYKKEAQKIERHDTTSPAGG